MAKRMDSLYCLYSLFWDIGPLFWAVLEVQVYEVGFEAGLLLNAGSLGSPAGHGLLGRPPSRTLGLLLKGIQGMLSLVPRCIWGHQADGAGASSPEGSCTPKP